MSKREQLTAAEVSECEFPLKGVTHTHAHTARLPHGYCVTFSFSPATGLGAEWAPHEPRIKSARAWRKFFAAYKTARDDFMRDVATMIGGTVLVADVGAADLAGVTTIKPEAVH